MAITRLTTLGIAGFAALAFIGLTLVPGSASAGAITGLANADQAGVHLAHHKGYKRHKGHHGGHHKKHRYGHNGGHHYKKHGGHHGHKKHHGLGHLLHGLLGGYNNHGGGHHKGYGNSYGHNGGGYGGGGYGGGHKKHHGGYAKHGYGRGCHQVTKQVWDDYGYRKTIAGTMCYDHYGQAYIVKGSRYVVGGGHSY